METALQVILKNNTDVAEEIAKRIAEKEYIEQSLRSLKNNLIAPCEFCAFRFICIYPVFFKDCKDNNYSTFEEKV